MAAMGAHGFRRCGHGQHVPGYTSVRPTPSLSLPVWEAGVHCFNKIRCPRCSACSNTPANCVNEQGLFAQQLSRYPPQAIAAAVVSKASCRFSSVKTGAQGDST